MLSPSEQKSNSTANGSSSAQLSRISSTQLQNSDLNMFLSGSYQNITAAGEVPTVLNDLVSCSCLHHSIVRSIFVPVCVESFCYASSRDGEAWLCVSVCQPREGRHSLHLPPAKLLQCIRVPFQQGWSAQVPQRSANMEASLSVGMRWRGATNVWCKWLGTLVAAGHPSGRHGCWTELQS